MSNQTIGKVIEGNRIYFKPVERADLDIMYKGINHSKLRRLTGNKKPATQLDLDHYYERSTNDPNRASFMICLQENDKIIGDIVLLDIHPSNRNGAVRLAIGDEAYLGKGYGTEALILMLDYAFGVLNLHRVQLDVFAFNERAIKSYEKVGFKEEGRLRDELFYDHAYHDSIIMSILEDEYRERYLAKS